jgi:GNAT superfamily N-acetyltransferase
MVDSTNVARSISRRVMASGKEPGSSCPGRPSKCPHRAQMGVPGMGPHPGWDTCQHGGVTTMNKGRLRTAITRDCVELLDLWTLLFDEGNAAPEEPWRSHAAEWFARFVDDTSNARFPVIEVDGSIVATAIGTLELGVPNPRCTKGRAVRLANVITVAGARGRGYATTLVLDVLDWARSIDADRVDLSATPQGQRLYQKLGFTVTSAPRMKLVL